MGDLADGELVYNDAVIDGDNDITVNVPAGLTQAVYYRARLYDNATAPAGSIEARDPGSYGGASGGEVEDGQSPAPTAVELARFEGWPEGMAIHVEWETVTEIDNLGFNLYRADAPDGPYVKLNEELIPSQAPGSPVRGGVCLAGRHGAGGPDLLLYAGGHGHLWQHHDARAGAW